MRIQLDLPTEDGTATRRAVFDEMSIRDAQVLVGVVGFFSGNNGTSRRKRGRTAETTGGTSSTKTDSDVDMPDAPAKTPSPEGSPAPKRNKKKHKAHDPIIFPNDFTASDDGRQY